MAIGGRGELEHEVVRIPGDRPVFERQQNWSAGIVVQSEAVLADGEGTGPDARILPTRAIALDGRDRAADKPFGWISNVLLRLIGIERWFATSPNTDQQDRQHDHNNEHGLAPAAAHNRKRATTPRAGGAATSEQRAPS